jgi:IS5 family transposase
MAKPRSGRQLSFETAFVYDDAAGIGPDHWCRLFFAEIYGGFDDADFADLYEERGRHPVSPSLLASLTLLQYMHGVSDRAAVDNTIMRRDWRVAVGIAADYEGFAPSVLCRFRQRLVAHGKEGEIFAKVLERIGELGLLKGRRKLRVDATHIVADVARLSRADLVSEAIRVVLNDVKKRYVKLSRRSGFRRLLARYGEEIWVGGKQECSDAKLTDLGRDGARLLELLGDLEAQGKATLARILEEHFIIDDQEGLRPRRLDEQPKDRIQTPHDPDVRRGRKRSKRWLGDKAHFVETADRGKANFVTDVIVTAPGIEDSTMTQEIAGRLGAATPEADTLIADGGYASGKNSRELREDGIDLVSPPRPNSRRGQIPLTEFEIDVERGVATCPEGHESVVWSEGEKSFSIRFARATCNACARKSECTQSDQGRSLRPSRESVQLGRDRARFDTDEWRALYRLRAPIEATISELVHVCGLRRSRYRGASFRRLHVLMSAAALNARRLLRALAADGPKPAKPTPSATVSQSQSRWLSPPTTRTAVAGIRWHWSPIAA